MRKIHVGIAFRKISCISIVSSLMEFEFVFKRKVQGYFPLGSVVSANYGYSCFLYYWKRGA